MPRPRPSTLSVRYPGADAASHRTHRNAAYPACPLCILERNGRVHALGSRPRR